jgi:2,3-bisphosphoglycerate-dependent phosphoglycerate mutase
MRCLILVRHATPARDPGRPARDWPLSPAGEADARQLADLLAAYAPTAIFSSDEQKAQATAAPLAGRLGLPVETVTGLHEHERRTTGYLDTVTFQANIARFFAEPDALVFGEETAHQALERFATAVADALARHPDGALALFTHGTVMTLFTAAHSAVQPLAFWRALGMPAWVVFSLPDLTLLETHLRLPAG